MKYRPRGENPYVSQPDQLTTQLSDPTINQREHEIYWPQFKAFLPLTANRVLDFGCGPGNFTADLAKKYPNAEVVGVDAVQDLLPDSSERLTFAQWDGEQPFEDHGDFDLIVTKMVLHYLSDNQLRVLGSHFVRLLEPGGVVAFSVPHPASSANYNEKKQDEWGRRHETGAIKREIGSTGIQATMYHRDLTAWTGWIYPRLNQWAKDNGREGYTQLLSEVVNEKGNLQRLNSLFVPNSFTEVSSPYDRVRELSGSSGDQVGVWADSSERELLWGDLSAYPRRPLP